MVGRLLYYICIIGQTYIWFPTFCIVCSWDIDITQRAAHHFSFASKPYYYMEDPKETVCQSYFFLKHEEASFLELLYLLCSSDVGKRRFIEIECSEEDVHKVTEFRRRWVIFISVVLQWSLLFFRDPLARIGDVFDKWLNVISANGGLLMFFINRLKGN